MHPQLLRITTEYVDTEDRLRLTGEVIGEQALMMWLTQRMLRVLVPHLLPWLEQSSSQDAYAEWMQGVAQQQAQAALEPQPEVRAAPGAGSWVVQAVDVSQTAQAITLRFRDGGDHAASLTLEPTPLRQWLGIVHMQCAAAGWALDIWPAWLPEGHAATVPAGVALH